VGMWVALLRPRAARYDFFVPAQTLIYQGHSRRGPLPMQAQAPSSVALQAQSPRKPRNCSPLVRVLLQGTQKSQAHVHLGL
jgi:hypothetical protein